MSADNRRIFISYTHKDLPRVKLLYKKLCEEGFEPWLDSEDITGGEDWKQAIKKAIKQSPFFLACLSRHSINHRGVVQVEFKEALKEWREKLPTDIYMIPVRLDDCEIPEENEFRNFQWIDLYKRNGFKKLTKSLREGFNRLGLIQKIKCRSSPIHKLMDEDVIRMLERAGYFEKVKKPTGTGIRHSYELVKKNKEKLIIDHATGLTWQQSGSPRPGVQPYGLSIEERFRKAQYYARQLSNEKYAGYSDWRLPTLEEAMCLMESKVNEHGNYINTVFNVARSLIWTSDRQSNGEFWVVDYSSGKCFYDNINQACYARAVR